MTSQDYEQSKDWIIDRYVSATLDTMDYQTLEDTLRYYIKKDLQNDTLEDIIAEAKDYYPDRFSDL